MAGLGIGGTSREVQSIGGTALDSDSRGASPHDADCENRTLAPGGSHKLARSSERSERCISRVTAMMVNG